MYASGISIPVVFVGRATSYISRLKRFLAENDMSAKAVFLADLPEEDLAGIYQCAVLSVYISVFEGFGLPVIEAMACGCPVITSTVSVLPETAGDAAVLCNPAKPEEIGAKIKMLLENEALRNQLIEKGYKRAKLFHPEKYAHNLNTLYEKVLIENNAQRH
jgi:glycosyltransferase involved in cell wall biosynthesis